MRSSRWQSFNPVWNQLQQLQEEMNHIDPVRRGARSTS
jgi:hypothetical protein